MSTALIAGATGMVGAPALRRLLEHPAFDAVVAAGRRALPAEPRLTSLVVDFARLDDTPVAPAQVALCALGTTMKQAGSPAAFRAVDHDAVVAFARWARRGGATTFALVSSAGADPGARNFYLQVKGETEQAVAEIGFPRFVALRPGLLLGHRAEARPAEAFARAVMPAINPLLPGRLRRWRGVPAPVVARALVAAAAAPDPGRFVWHVDEIVAHA